MSIDKGGQSHRCYSHSNYCDHGSRDIATVYRSDLIEFTSEIL